MNTLRLVDTMTGALKRESDVIDRIQLQRLQSDLETLMLRHGRGKVIGVCVEAIRSAEFRGAKW